MLLNLFAASLGLFGAVWGAHVPDPGHDADLTTVSRVEQAVGGDFGPPPVPDAIVLLPDERPAPDNRRLLRMCRSRPGHSLRHPQCRWALAAATGGVGVAGVQGLVMDTGGAPLEGITVTIAGSGKTVAAKTDSSGQFRALLESGEYRISIDPAQLGLRGDHPAVAARRIRLGRGRPVRVDFVVPPGPFTARRPSSAVR